VLFVRFGTRAGVIGGGVVRLLEVTKRLQTRCNFYMITHEVTFSWLKQLGLTASPHYLVKSCWAWTQDVASLIFCTLKAIIGFRVRDSIDVVYSFTHSLPDLLPSVWIKILTKAKLIIYLQTPLIPPKSPPEGGLLGPFLHRLDHFISSLLVKRVPDLVFVFNEYDKQELVKRGVHMDKIQVISYGVDIKRVNQVPEQEKKYSGMFLGRLGLSKGVFDLIEVWKCICQVKPNSKLLIVGPGLPERVEELRKMILERGLSSNVLLSGPLYEEEKFKALKSSKLFLNPSYIETWCITICEAMACGCAVVAYDLPSYKSVYGDAISTARIGDIHDFSQKVLYLLENDDARKKLVDKALTTVIQYDWSRTAEKEFNFLNELTLS